MVVQVVRAALARAVERVAMVERLAKKPTAPAHSMALLLMAVLVLAVWAVLALARGPAVVTEVVLAETAMGVRFLYAKVAPSP